MGLSDDEIRRLEAAGISTLAGMAFFCAYQPGTSDDSTLVAAASAALAQDPVPPATMVAIRRLHFESHAMYVADLKSKIMSTEDEVPKRMPNAERSTRYREQQQRLSGLILEGELECANSLLDSVMQQYDRDELKYLVPNVCISREQELTGQRKDPKLALDSEGQLRLKAQNADVKADVSTDMKLKQAMTRRGLAYDQCGLITFGVHAKWIEKLFTSLNRTVPEGYASISLHQLMEADKELWQRLADECRTSIIPVAGMPRQLDDAINKWSASHEVLYYLMPLPASKGATTSYGAHKEVPTERKNPYVPKGGKKGGGKGKKGKGNSSMPPGCVNKTKEGKNLCFAFNSPAGCSYAKAGGQCRRGVHVCARPNCFGKHAATGCPGGQ